MWANDRTLVWLTLPFHSRPTSSQIKKAYRKKVWESYPNLFLVHEKHSAESKFKLVSIDVPLKISPSF
ncbi:hypothetical protein ES288_D13G060000v1 [Gossypium darwinii]|uniref:J domain-containing protein n=1 Tax=Gossypium darwinii TaxID=34276 RepID=A0A5D1ZVK7_GOSDA|nr:hypothetical protein ES288_D13G060000v1 [Gossypium darwinii]